MQTFETGFLAEEWYDFLKEEVEHKFPGIRFGTYTPSSDLNNPAVICAKCVSVIIDDKAIFKYSLKGTPLNSSAVTRSLIHYVKQTHNKVMRERSFYHYKFMTGRNSENHA
jgi:hypothetical protein